MVETMKNARYLTASALLILGVGDLVWIQQSLIPAAFAEGTPASIQAAEGSRAPIAQNKNVAARGRVSGPALEPEARSASRGGEAASSRGEAKTIGQSGAARIDKASPRPRAGEPQLDGTGREKLEPETAKSPAPRLGGEARQMAALEGSTSAKSQQKHLPTHLAAQGAAASPKAPNSARGFEGLAQPNFRISFRRSGRVKVQRKGRRVLQKVARHLRRNPELFAELRGHSDASGKDEINLFLSRRRAEHAKAFLIREGIAAQRLTVVGAGSSQPAHSGSSLRAMRRNRRVDIYFRQEKP